MMPILLKSNDVRSGRKAKGRHGPLWRLGSQWVNKKAKNPNFAEFLAFWGLFGIGFANVS